MDDPTETVTHEALKRLREDIPRSAEILGLSKTVDLGSWKTILDTKLLPRISGDFPVIATICGGGSSGKSTLFNALAGTVLSPTGGRAGINRRILAAGHPDIILRDNFQRAMFDPLGTLPRRLENPGDLSEPGGPLIATSERIPRQLVLMDTPDFDTGAGGTYVNRDVTQRALEASDILIYIFTNSNYNNRDNTDFIARMLTGIGLRKCFLVYRVYPSFSDREVLDHARQVGRNIYGDSSGASIIGIYRADEDNRVAAGKRAVAVRPVTDGPGSLQEALGRVDPLRERRDLIRSMVSDVIAISREILRAIISSREALALYLDALQTAQSHCVHQAVAHFPADRVLKRFFEIWLSTDPAPIKVMRKTGSLIEMPLKLLTGALKLARGGRPETGTRGSSEEKFRRDVEEDLLGAINALHGRILSPELSVSTTPSDPACRRMQGTVDRIRASIGLTGGELPRRDPSPETGGCRFTVAVHPAVSDAQKGLRDRDWESVIRSILSEREVIFMTTGDIDGDLTALVNRFRTEMGFWSRVRQTFSAFLNVVPAAAAVTYVIHTGDPVGAAGIKIKLTGLFGLHDLYALVAIPATSGMKRADLLQLQEMIRPIARAWLTRKMESVREIFEARISGTVLAAAREATLAVDPIISSIESSLAGCGKVPENR
jgi:energy-coupling factor transporter ATP-binding protein EcfA2